MGQHVRPSQEAIVSVGYDAPKSAINARNTFEDANDAVSAALRFFDKHPQAENYTYTIRNRPGTRSFSRNDLSAQR